MTRQLPGIAVALIGVLILAACCVVGPLLMVVMSEVWR
jgi:hypothetical protein